MTFGKSKHFVALKRGGAIGGNTAFDVWCNHAANILTVGIYWVVRQFSQLENRNPLTRYFGTLNFDIREKFVATCLIAYNVHGWKPISEALRQLDVVGIKLPHHAKKWMFYFCIVSASYLKCNGNKSPSLREVIRCLCCIEPWWVSSPHWVSASISILWNAPDITFLAKIIKWCQYLTKQSWHFLLPDLELVHEWNNLHGYYGLKVNLF